MQRKAKKGFSGHPLATIALYGPDDRTATKLVASIFAWDGADPEPMRKWHSSTDVRGESGILEEVRELLATYSIKSVVMTDRIIGCPHEEDVDYPRGQPCPRCPFWRGIDRWTGRPIH